MKLFGVVIANGFSSEARVFANLLSERGQSYRPLVAFHDPKDAHLKDEGAAAQFERETGATLFRIEAGWRRNDDDRRTWADKADSLRRFIGAMPRLIERAWRFHPDLVYSSQQRWDCLVATAIAVTLRVPQVVHLHYLVGPWLGHQALRRLRHAEGVVCVSEFIRNQAIEHGVAPDRTCVIPNTIKLPAPLGSDERAAVRQRLGFDPEVFVYSFVARLADGKGHEDTLRALVHVKSVRNNVRLLIVGDGPLRARLETIARQLQLSRFVQFLGHRKDVSQILSASDAFVHPSMNEPFGLAILEACAASLPTVAYDQGGPREILRSGTTGILVAPRDVSALSRAMLELATNPELATSLGREARADVEARFSPRQHAESFAEFLRATARRRGAQSHAGTDTA